MIYTNGMAASPMKQPSFVKGYLKRLTVSKLVEKWRARGQYYSYSAQVVFPSKNVAHFIFHSKLNPEFPRSALLPEQFG